MMLVSMRVTSCITVPGYVMVHIKTTRGVCAITYDNRMVIKKQI